MKNKFKNVVIVLVVIAFIMAGFVPLRTQATETTDYSAVFDADYYSNTYPDLKAAFGNDKTALLQHFITYGMGEGRNGNASFNVSAYMENNPDLIAAFGREDLKSYYLHYINYGKKEGRTATGTGTNTNMPEAASNSPDNLIASYTTAYDPSESRAINIALSASKINGVVVKPGESFSFSNTVGPRTAANGFVIAPTFVNRQVVNGMGGGICQVSSTVYAAMITGGIPATERHAHSLPVSYIPQGMDATIVAGAKDLRFKNIYDYSILISATTGDGTVTISFYRQ